MKIYNKSWNLALLELVHPERAPCFSNDLHSITPALKKTFPSSINYVESQLEGYVWPRSHPPHSIQQWIAPAFTHLLGAPVIKSCPVKTVVHDSPLYPAVASHSSSATANKQGDTFVFGRHQFFLHTIDRLFPLPRPGKKKISRSSYSVECYQQIKVHSSRPPQNCCLSTSDPAAGFVFSGLHSMDGNNKKKSIGRRSGKLLVTWKKITQCHLVHTHTQEKKERDFFLVPMIFPK